MRIYDRQYVSVSTVLGIFDKYPGIGRDILAKAAKRGRAVHAAAALINQGISWLPPDIPESVMPYVEQYRRCRDHHIGRVHLVEKPLVHRIFGYGGQPDFTAEVKGAKHSLPALHDIKVTAEIGSPYVAIQEAAYQELLEHNGYKIAREAYVVHIGESFYQYLNTWQYFEIEPEAARQAWHYCLWLFQFLNQRRS